ncbi:unnamed protein product [Peronospora belbahrii]|uniref:Uncharacterized protein n=1 Tax=Peronospora belbahrii TaxID=622444 RepID=A0AAU9L4H0_9STRA|nr:unnamed protein product [Peronospora belbahrii]CAH0516871.1 unnamed protein product [Peronospora belbahrii]
MRTHCNSVRRQFNCKFAPYFMNFRLGAEILIEKALTSNLVLPNVNITATTSRDGIVIIVYPKLLASAYASLRVLRHVLHCDLPIAIFYRPDELTAQDQRFKPIQDFAAKNQKITFQEIHDPHAKRFLAKIYAIYHTTFDRVLFLDADNVPVRDPSFLFESREFLDTGAMFWPDFWYPGHSMFGLSTHSLVWELLDLPFVDMFEQESGQVLIDRRRHALPLELVRYYGFHRPNFFTSLKLAWGDKDLFRFAWLKLNVPFTMIQTPPAMAGVIVEKSRATRDFCGMTMVQHDANGEILFVHRNRVKLTGTFADQNHIDTMHDDLVGDHSIYATGAALDTVVKYPDPTIWTHVARFRMESDRKHYTIKSFMANLSFKSRQKCYGLRDVDQNPHFYIQDIAALNLSGLESHLQQYALESVEYLSKNVSKG